MEFLPFHLSKVNHLESPVDLDFSSCFMCICSPIQEPNPPFKRTRVVFRVLRLVPSAAPLNGGVGRIEERARARRAVGSTAVLGRGCAEGKASVCTTRFFWALVVVRGVSVCSNPPGFQAGVVQAVRPPSPLSALLGFRAGPLAFFGPVGVGKCRPFPRPNPALKGTRGYALAGFPPVPPARAP